MKFSQYFFLHNTSQKKVYFNNMGKTQNTIIKDYFNLMFLRNKFEVYNNVYKYKPYKYRRYYFTFNVTVNKNTIYFF